MQRSGLVDIQLDERPYVPVYLNGHGPFHFLLDTGAVTPDISVPIAEKLQLPVSAMHPDFRVVNSLRIGDMEWPNYDIAIREEHPWIEGLGLYRDGFIGFTMIMDLVVTIDYPEKRLELSEAAYSPDCQESSPTSFSLELREHQSFNYRYTVVPVIVNGSGPYRFLLDTGANRCLVSPQLVEKLNLQAEEDEGRPRFYLQSFRLGSVEKNDLLASLWDCSRVAVEEPLDGYVGHNFLQDVAVTLDYPRQEMWLHQADK